MAASSYDAALARVLAHEGGYCNHPADPGGPTNFGITIADYRRYEKPNATAADVRAMDVAVAKTIYRDKYWTALRCDELPPGLDYAVFDYAVNSGTGRAAGVLRTLLGRTRNGTVTDDVVAAAAVPQPAALIGALCRERLTFLEHLKTWPVFGAGWRRRVAEVKAAALALATSAPTPAPAVPTQAKGFAPAASAATDDTFNVHWLQLALNTLGALPPLADDGVSGPHTHTAVAAFQRRHHLAADGIAGPRTRAALEHALAAHGGAALL